MSDQILPDADTYDDREVDHGNPVMGLELRGFEEIPAAWRRMRVDQVYQLWFGTNANLIFVTFGALGIVSGLSFWQAVGAVVIGSFAYLYVGICSIGAARSGMPVTTFSRASFGVRGNFPNAFLAWIVSVGFEAVNTIYGVFAFSALFKVLGWNDADTTLRLVAIVLQLALGAGIAVLGHATLVYLQRFFAFFIGLILLLIGFWIIPLVNFSRPASVELTAGFSIAATILTAAGIVASGAISYVYNAPDWVRYLSPGISNGKIVGHVTAAAVIPSLALSIIGVMMGTLGDMADPVGAMEPFLPTWLFICYIVAAIGGAISNNAPTYYSSGLAIQAMGIPLHRHWATLLDSLIATCIVIYVIFVSDFLSSLNNFLSFLVVWAGPYAGVWVADGLKRRWRFDASAIHDTSGQQSAYWYKSGVNPIGWSSLLLGMIAAVLTMHSPVFVGAIAQLLDGADISWIVGFFVSLIAYEAMARGRA